ncbi:hypothetical protein FCU94_15650 [Vibrio sp. JPW-9-11-11]|uniref:hypothetical protein n=1 Tax=Vibrio sp. JPW-9-11-11 TaxID=1416532 RepID=UPI00159399BA|nr:hypothetical protein [Vibrio sp. JPW-9-11-11]NVD08295.1 hypothetical protein [Vibrio sp. JPW-9-11-11]
MENSKAIDSIPKYISTLVPAILSLSVVYDLGFFSGFGLTFSEVPTTISDHLRSSLIWLPAAILCVFFVTVVELFTSRVEQGKSESEIINGSPNPERTALFRKSPIYLITAITIAIPFASFLGVEIPLTGWQFFFIAIWFLFHNFVFGHERIFSQTPRALWVTSRWIPAVVLWVLFAGLLSAKKAIDDPETVKIELSDKVVERVVLRAYDKFYLVYNPKQEVVSVLNAGEVKSIDSSSRK